MTQDEFNKAPKLDQILYDCTGMLVKNHPDIADAMQKYADQQLLIQGDAISLARAEKYGRHQHHLGTQQKALVSLEDWRQDYCEEQLTVKEKKCEHENEIMRKNIDIPDEIVKPLKILAIEADKDLKNYIQDLLVAHTGKYKKK